uniref:Chemokine interleukin-8-like domain-containing protein n=1 Tax=Rhinopithecus roxellana TaxID=61622 RepID=A0A2K6NZF3_RHIRO
MKVSVAALAVILVTTALCAPASASPCKSCLHVGKHRMSGKCSKSARAVNFVTRKNRQVCANPEKKWVREYINSLEMS